MDTKEYTPLQITVLLQPEGREFSLPRPKTVLQLLHKLDIRRGAALIIRDGGLFTEDCRIFPADHITVRVVTSSG